VPGCASLTGQVTNWGSGPQGGIETELKTGSWRTATTSSSDGNFGFGGLGVGLARLHVPVAPGDQRQPLIQDAGVYLNCNYLTVANIAFYSGKRVDPPATIEMSAPSQTVTPGSNFEITLTIKNSLLNDISNVIVTDMMPRGFTALKVTSSIDPKDARIINGGPDGQLVALNLDKLAAGAEATIGLTVNADVDLLSGAQIRNAATLFYRESAADQTWLDFTVGGDDLSVPAASASIAGDAGLTSPGESSAAGGDLNSGGGAPVAEDASASPVKEAAAGEEFVPPGNMPPTGAELPLPDTFAVAGEPGLSGVRVKLTNNLAGLPDRVDDASLHPHHYMLITTNPGSGQVTVVHTARPNGPSITVATAVLFLGLLVLGSGITLWRYRSDW
jgi:uncharacterized repeat protein (TIGR01451 family)